MIRQELSLVIAAYQAEAILGQTLASVLTSEVLPNEIIVVDDGSKDGTFDVIRSWQDRLPIRPVQLAVNVGLGAARQAAMEVVDTPLVAFLDADDVILPNHFQLLLELHDRNGGIVTPRPLLWLPSGELRPMQRPLGRSNVPRKHQLKHLLHRNYLMAAVLTDTEAVRRAGGFRAIRRAEDWDLWLRMVTNGARVSRPESFSICYRLTPGSLSATETVQLQASLDVIRHWHEEHLDHPLADEVAEVEKQLLIQMDLCRVEADTRSSGKRVPVADGVKALSGDTRTAVRAVARMTLPRRLTDRVFGWGR